MNNKQKPRYDGHCRDAHIGSDAENFVVRFRNPETGSVVFEDMVHGHTEFQNSELDDLIIARSDGTPTYNFTVVVDDMDMQITHVTRGDDHLNNTPRQINILKALAAVVPTYAHLPMILGPDGKRLSKRHGAVSVMQYHEDGYLPEALLNYLLRLGWSHGDQEIFSREEMVLLFDTKDVNKAAASINPEKLLWINQHYIKSLPLDKIVAELQKPLQQAGLDVSQGPELPAVVEVLRERCKTLLEIVDSCHFLYSDINNYDEKALAKHIKPETKDILTFVQQGLQGLSQWDEESIHAVINQTAEKFSVKLGKIAPPLRIALTGSTVSPPINATICLVGQERATQRIAKLLASLT